jgi:hypothetical protein
MKMGKAAWAKPSAMFTDESHRQQVEYGKMQETYNPFINRINQVVQHRLLHPNDDIPEPYEVLVRYMNPPEKLVEEAQSELDSLISAADVKKGKAILILSSNYLLNIYCPLLIDSTT